MEQFKFDYPQAKRPVTKKAHVGVVGSGDMEILMEPSSGGAAHVTILTSVNGFGTSWKAVFDYLIFQSEGPALEHLSPQVQGLFGELTEARADRIRSILLKDLNRNSR